MMKMKTTMTSLLLLLSMAVLLQTASATITIADTGERFPSHPDRLVGTRWMEGYEYMARLQVIERDLDLCSTVNDKLNLTVSVPSDGLPVVLVTRGDDCSDLTKVQTALSRIEPKGVVKYLVIYDDAVHPPVRHNSRRLSDGVDMDEEEAALNDDEWESSSSNTQLLQDLAQKIVEQHMLPPSLPSTTTTTNDADDGDFDWNRHRDDYDHRMGVLHVSFKTGNGKCVVRSNATASFTCLYALYLLVG